MQAKILLKKMLEESKTRNMLMNFDFNGKVKKYLTVLPFQKARIIFMFRAKMFLVKANYPGRWNSGDCYFCKKLDSDIHLFSCYGYSDIVKSEWKPELFYSLNADTDLLGKGASMLLKLHSRLEQVNGVIDK